MEYDTLCLVLMGLIFGGFGWERIWWRKSRPTSLAVVRSQLRFSHLGCGASLFLLVCMGRILWFSDEEQSPVQLKFTVYLFAVALMALFFFVLNSWRINAVLDLAQRKAKL